MRRLLTAYLLEQEPILAEQDTAATRSARTRLAKVLESMNSNP